MTKQEKYLKLLDEITEFIGDYGTYNRKFNLIGYETQPYTLYFNSNTLPHGRWQLMVWNKRKTKQAHQTFSRDVENYDGLVELFSRPELFGILKAIAYKKLLARLVRYIKEKGRYDQIQCGEYIFTYEPFKYADCVRIEDTTQNNICGKYFPTEIDGHGTQFDELMEILNKPKLLHILKEIS